jgi:hypothetical protein
MPYISSESITAKRKAIKDAFPSTSGWKFSITKENYSSINIAILEAPIQLLHADKIERGYEQVNHFYAHEHFEGEAKDAICKIIKIANDSNEIESVDGDYGNIPSFYVNVTIGQWDRLFKLSR